MIGLAVPARAQVLEEFEFGDHRRRGLPLDGRGVAHGDRPRRDVDDMDAAAGGIRHLERMLRGTVVPELQAFDGRPAGDRDDERQPGRIVDAEGEFGGHRALHGHLVRLREGGAERHRPIVAHT